VSFLTVGCLQELLLVYIRRSGIPAKGTVQQCCVTTQITCGDEHEQVQGKHEIFVCYDAESTSDNAENKSDEDIRYGSHTTRVQKWMFVQRSYQEQVFAIAGLAG
jgi:hypothetical protein